MRKAQYLFYCFNIAVEKIFRNEKSKLNIKPICDFKECSEIAKLNTAVEWSGDWVDRFGRRNVLDWVEGFEIWLCIIISEKEYKYN